MKMKLGIVLVAVLAGPAFAQQQPGAQQTAPQAPGHNASPDEPRVRMRGPGGGQFRGTAGEITEISGDTITLKAMTGNTVKVKVTSDTRFRKDMNTDGKLSDFKVGDVIIVRGEPSGENQFTAQTVLPRSAMSTQGPGGGMPVFAQFNPADMGKTFILGEVTKIDGTTLTIRRPDRQEQPIEVDENTSFRKQRESITLPDIKVGDTVMGRGALKEGVFVPTTLNVVDPQMLQRFMQMQQQAPAQPPKK